MLRRLLFNIIRDVTRKGTHPVDFSHPRGDPGLFGPNSMCWQVHQDFMAMMIGGVSALMLQTLHPRALAGVWDHSNFREDLKGRLGRTAFFISCTTYGSSAVAEQAIAHVRRVHQRVTGTAPDGRPYSANDGELLTWVHATEVSSFLQAYLQYVNPHLSGREQDQYFAEMAILATQLGASAVPDSRKAMADYLAAQRAQLVCSERSREVIAVLHQFEPRLASRLFIAAGGMLLPEWGQTLLGLRPRARVSRWLIRFAIRAISPVVRWALARDGIATQARQRCQGLG